MKELVFATHNRHKLAEVQAMAGSQYQLISLDDLGCTEEIAETGLTFHENSSIKSGYISSHYGKDCFADDSGLQVHALNNEPGVYSARYAGEPKNDLANTNLLLANMQGITNRAASFITVICLVQDGKEYFFEGELCGTITDFPRGSNGFGYDPVFIPEGDNRTLAELSPEEKNSISHRGKALRKLMEFLVK